MKISNENAAQPCMIIFVAYEGGGARVFGREVNGVWSYWQEGGSMQDEDDEGKDWKYWTDDPVANLADALPGSWVMMSPVEIHPSFLGWFREHYEIEREKLSAYHRDLQKRRLHTKWLDILSNK